MMVHARGPVWHRKQQAQGIIPKGLRGLDTDGTWSYSRSEGWVYGHGTFCLVACKHRILGAFKWMRNSANEAKRMWLETGKLKGLITTVLMDSKADDQGFVLRVATPAGDAVADDRPQGSGQKPGAPTDGQGPEAEQEPAALQAAELYGRADAGLTQRHLRVGAVLDAGQGE